MPANPPVGLNDPATWGLYPKKSSAVASLAADVDISVLFPEQGFCRRIYLAGGTGNTGNIAVLRAGDTVPVTYVAPTGTGTNSTVLFGCFVTLKSTANGTSTAAANIILEE